MLREIEAESKRLGVTVKVAEWTEWINPYGQRETVKDLKGNAGFHMIGAWFKHNGQAYELVHEIQRSKLIIVDGVARGTILDAVRAEHQVQILRALRNIK